MADPQTTTMDLPALSAHPVGTPAWDGIEGLRLKEIKSSSVVEGQPTIELAATRNNSRHRLGIAFRQLISDRIYRATAWVKVTPATKIMLDVRDGAHSCRNTADFGPEFEPVRRRTTGPGSSASEPGDASEWSCASIDVRSMDGVVVVYVGLVDRASNVEFECKDDLELTFGGIDIAPLIESANPRGPASAKAKLICVGTGRDGTQSLYRMIQTVFDRTDGRRAMHEYCCREFYQAFCNYRETSDVRALEDIHRMIIECPYDCIVGNGYAAILPLFREHWGPDTRLLHLRRSNRSACIESLVRNAELFPKAYQYYSSSEEATVKRMAAFHFGEMPMSEWNQQPATMQFCWYYDKTHALVEQHEKLFTAHFELSTEQLSTEEGCHTVARWAGESEALVPRHMHLNAHSIDVAAAPKEHREKLFWLMGRLNLYDMCLDDTYPMDYFVNKFIAWTGYQIRNAPGLGTSRRQTREERAETLGRANVILSAALSELDSLRELNLKSPS